MVAPKIGSTVVIVISILWGIGTLQLWRSARAVYAYLDNLSATGQVLPVRELPFILLAGAHRSRFGVGAYQPYSSSRVIRRTRRVSRGIWLEAPPAQYDSSTTRSSVKWIAG